MNRLLPLAGLLAVSVSSLAAQNYYLQGNQFTGLHWETVNNDRGWFTAASGGSRLLTFQPAGNYHNNGFTIYTKETIGDVFAGNSLTLSGGMLEIRHTSASVTASTVGDLIIGAAGSMIGTRSTDAAIGSGLNITKLTVNGTLMVGQSASNRTVRLNIGTVSGTANIQTNGHTNVFSISDATAYTGNIVHAAGVLDFNSSFTSAGGLILSNSSAPLVLDQNLTFTFLTIGATTFDTAGTYTFNQLNTAYDAYFVNGGTGSITIAPIPEPAAAAALVGAFALGCATLRRRRVRA